MRLHLPLLRRVTALAAVVFAASLVIATAACGGPKPGNPALPEGFRETQVPDASLKGYAYVKPGTPVLVSLRKMFSEAEMREVPDEVGISLVAVWVGPSPKHYGAGLRFTDTGVLDAVVNVLEKQGKRDIMRAGEWLYFFGGDGEWVAALRAAINEGRFVKIEDAYPEEWEMIRLLPEKPGVEMVGAGFGKLDEEFVASLDELPEFGGDVKSLAESAKLQSAAFGLYAKVVPASISDFSEKSIKQLGPVGIVVTRTGYPGFLIGFMFGRAASGAGLENVQIKDGDAYYKAMREDMHIFIKNRSSIFYITAATERDDAQSLMESVFAE